ncbi:MAG: hypothetical protein AB7T06_21440 [Kofleriaceae bacterium]
MTAPPKARISNPRWLWITSLVVGGICTIAFIAMWLAPTEPSTPGPTPTGSSGLGFGAGVLIGLAAGIAIGFAIARQRGADSR